MRTQYGLSLYEHATICENPSKDRAMGEIAIKKNFDYFFRRLNPSTTFEQRAASHYANAKGMIEDGDLRRGALEDTFGQSKSRPCAAAERAFGGLLMRKMDEESGTLKEIRGYTEDPEIIRDLIRRTGEEGTNDHFRLPV